MIDEKTFILSCELIITGINKRKKIAGGSAAVLEFTVVELQR